MIIEDKWNSEPNELIFNHLGFKCVCKRQRVMKTWLGYIIIPKDHPWFSIDQAIFNEIKLIKDRKISYTGHCPFSPEPRNDEWWIGFDCTQEFDLIPMHWESEGQTHPKLFRKHTYKDLEFVKSRLRMIAESAQRMYQEAPVEST